MLERALVNSGYQISALTFAHGKQEYFQYGKLKSLQVANGHLNCERSMPFHLLISTNYSVGLKSR